MPAQVQAVLDRLSGTMRQFSTAQRTLGVIGIAVVVLGAVALSSWVSRPTMSPLFADLSGPDASAIVDQLDAAGVQYELADGGSTVLVPADKLYGLRIDLAAAGLPANADGGGYSLLDDMGMTSSEFQQDVTYQRALEGELAKTVSALDGVETATVKLALPEESVFVEETADPTASVFVRTRPGAELSNQQVESIVHLVSAGIPGMKPVDVAVVDASGKVLSAVGTGPGGGNGDGQATGEYESRVASAVQEMLDQVVGAGKAVVTVAADLDFDATQRTSETYTATPDTPPLSSSTTTEEYTGGGTPTGGVLGPDNIQVPSGTAGDGSYSNTSETLNNAINKVTEATTTAPGSVRRQSIAVAVDQEAAAGVDMTQLTALVKAAAGIDTERGDTVAVSRMVFDTTSAEAAQEALAAADAAQKKAETASLIKQGAIAGILLLAVLVIAFLARRKANKARREALDIGELHIVPPSPTEAAIAAIEAAEDQLPALPPAHSPEPLPDIEFKRAEIAALADEQPGEVADLLRGWLATSGSARRH